MRTAPWSAIFIAARDPQKHLSLIQFTAWSSLVHGLIMLWLGLKDPVERPNLFGDVPALVLIGVVLMFLTPRGSQSAGDTPVTD